MALLRLIDGTFFESAFEMNYVFVYKNKFLNSSLKPMKTEIPIFTIESPGKLVLQPAVPLIVYSLTDIEFRNH